MRLAPEIRSRLPRPGQEASGFDQPVLAAREHDDAVGPRTRRRDVAAGRAGKDHEPAEEGEQRDAAGCSEQSACSCHVSSPNGHPGMAMGMAVIRAIVPDLDAFVTRNLRVHK
jgi:hypothetical protein